MEKDISIPEEIIELLHRRDTVKAVATTDDRGVPHLVYKGFADTDDEGHLVLLELLETSQTNHNLVHSLWFGRKVSVSLLAADGRSFEIKGFPYRSVISGAIFERYYRQVRKILPGSDLSAVWLITPEAVKNIGYRVRKEEEETLHPLIGHLDRIARQSD